MNIPSSILLVSAMVVVFLAIACASGRPMPAAEGTPDIGATVEAGISATVVAKAIEAGVNATMSVPSSQTVNPGAAIATTTAKIFDTTKSSPTAPSSATSMSALIDTKIAFSSDLHLAPSLSRPGDREIYVMNSDGTGQTRLTKNAAMDTNPSWSPDGTKIAFSSEGFLTTGRRSGRTDIYVMNSDGGDLTRITYLTESAGGPSWSPDGTKIAFTYGDLDTAIYVMNADGTSPTRLTSAAFLTGSPSWSPDGAKIAFSSVANSDSEIFVINPDGTGLINLTNSLGMDFSPSWSPDGTKIVFTADRYGGRQIYVINADGNEQTRLTNDPVVPWSPSWPPDGTKIAFDAYHPPPNPKYMKDIFVMNADGTGKTRLTKGRSPSWSPFTR